MTADARQIVDQHRDRPVIEVGRILVEQGHVGTDYQRPAMAIAAYWQHQQARIESGEIDRGCDGPCQPWTNAAGRVMCPHSGLICAGHCNGELAEHGQQNGKRLNHE